MLYIKSAELTPITLLFLISFLAVLMDTLLSALTTPNGPPHRPAI